MCEKNGHAMTVYFWNLYENIHSTYFLHKFLFSIIYQILCGLHIMNSETGFTLNKHLVTYPTPDPFSPNTLFVFLMHLVKNIIVINWN